MLNISTEVVHTRKNVAFEPYQCIRADDIERKSQSSDDTGRIESRHEKSFPSIKQRKLEQNSTGRRASNVQYKEGFIRLPKAQPNALNLNRRQSKVTSLPPIHHSTEPPRTHTLRLSAIVEENPSIATSNKHHLIQGRVLSLSPSRTSSNRLTPTLKPSIRTKINCSPELYHLFDKYSLHRMIAKTSDDRLYFQQHANLLTDQKRFREQKLKELLQ